MRFKSNPPKAHVSRSNYHRLGFTLEIRFDVRSKFIRSLSRLLERNPLQALSFGMAAIVQSWIEADLTKVPKSGDQNSMMVLNGIYNSSIT